MSLKVSARGLIRPLMRVTRRTVHRALTCMVLATLLVPQTAAYAAIEDLWGTVAISGSYWGGVDVMYNGSSWGYFPDRLNYIGSVQTGVKWQAEELAQRFYYVKYGMPSPWPISKPADIYTVAPSLGLTVVPNNGTSLPEWGDLIVWRSHTNPYLPDASRGHVAIANKMTSTGLEIVHQNGADPGISVVGVSGNRLTDSNILGWVKHPTAGQFPPADIVTASVSAFPASPSDSGQALFFGGSATDSKGEAITAYEWTSDIAGVLSTAASFSTSSLPVGTHVITFKAKCAGGAWSTPVSRTLVVQAPDVVTAVPSISPNPAAVGQSITISAGGTDSLGHQVVAYEWRINGILVNTAQTFNKTYSTAGDRTIGLRVKCDNGVWSPEVVRTLSVGTTTPPQETVTATINSATPNPASTGQTVSFTGSAASSTGNAIAAYEWTEGTTVLSTAASFSKGDLPAGNHSVSFRAKSSSGTWSAAKSVTIAVNAPEAVTVTAASATPSAATVGQAISLTGSATDSLGNPLTYQWTEGATVLSNAASFSTSTLAVGTHTLTFKATSSTGVSATRTVTVAVSAAESVTVSTVSATPNPSTVGQAVNLSAAASSSYGNAVSYQWTEGATVLSNAASFSTSALAVGTHTITVKATSTTGVSATRTVSVTVNPAPVETVTVSAASATPNPSVVGQTVSFSGSASSSAGSGIVYQWLEGTTVLSNAQSFSTALLTVGTHTITLKATSSTGVSATRTVSVTVNPAAVETVTATIVSVTPNPAKFRAVVTLTGSGTASTGATIVGYEWSEGTRILSTARSFSSTSFKKGTHTISFRVRGSGGTWSAPVTTKLVVQ